MHITEELLWAYLHDETDQDSKQLIEDHLENCVSCQDRFVALQKSERFFQNIKYPEPSDRFAALTSALALSETRSNKRPWITIFKICLSISLILIVILCIWIVTGLEVSLPISDKTAIVALHTLPLILLVFFMTTFEKRMLNY